MQKEESKEGQFSHILSDIYKEKGGRIPSEKRKAKITLPSAPHIISTHFILYVLHVCIYIRLGSSVNGKLSFMSLLPRPFHTFPSFCAISFHSFLPHFIKNIFDREKRENVCTELRYNQPLAFYCMHVHAHKKRKIMYIPKPPPSFE